MARRSPASAPGWQAGPPRPELAPGARVHRVPRELGQVMGRMPLPGLMEDLLLARIDAFWADLVGAQIAGLAQVESLQAGELRVAVRHPVWRTELAGLAEDLRSRINSRLAEQDDIPREPVRRLRFV